MPLPTVYVVGADKGGVGKTTIARLLLDYFRANNIEFKAFDTEHPSGGLQRFFPEKVQVIDITKSNDQMKVFDNMGTAPATVIDIRAGLLSPTLKEMSVIGLLDAAKANKIRVNVLHVLGASAQSLDEVNPIVAALAGARHIAIANHIDDTPYNAPAGALNIPKLDGEAAKAVDAAALPFSEFVNSQASFVLRGKTRHFMAAVFDQFNSAQLNVLA